jgi:hypothetical protein
LTRDMALICEQVGTRAFGWQEVFRTAFIDYEPKDGELSGFLVKGQLEAVGQEHLSAEFGRAHRSIYRPIRGLIRFGDNVISFGIEPGRSL